MDETWTNRLRIGHSDIRCLQRWVRAAQAATIDALELMDVPRKVGQAGIEETSSRIRLNALQFFRSGALSGLAGICVPAN